LRSLYESLRLKEPQTLLQSGNVIFRTDERDLASVQNRIEAAIERTFGFRPALILRTAAQMRDAAGRNPFAARSGINPSRLVVMFLGAEPSAEIRDRILRLPAEPEELHIAGREIFVYCPNGTSRTRLSWPEVEKALRMPVTGRNWNTVTKLVEMAAKLGG